MAVTDYNKVKKLEASSVNDAGATMDKAQAILINNSELTISSPDYTFNGHTNDVWSVAVDSNGNVYTASSDNSVKKIDSNGDEVWTFNGHTDWVKSVAVDSNGNVYTASEDNAVKKIDSNGNEVWTFTGHTNDVYGVAADSNGNVYSASRDDTVKKIDSSGTEVWTFTGHTSSVQGVAVDSDGYVYTASNDDTVKKIDSNGNEVWTFTGHTGSVYSVAVDSNGNVYSGSFENTLKKIDSNGNEVWTFTGHIDTVNGVAVDSNGNVYTASYDNTVKKIDSSGNELDSFSVDDDNALGVGISPLADGTQYLAAGTGFTNYRMYRWSAVTEDDTGPGSIILDWTNISSESDIGLYDQNGNLLPYEIESFDATAETATLWCYNSWVRDDTVQAQILYGDGPTSSEENVTGTWNNAVGEENIYHANQPNYPTDNIIDSNDTNRDGAVTGATSATLAPGGAIDFDGVDDFADLGAGDTAPLAGATSATFKATINHDNLPDNSTQRYYAIHDTTGADIIFGTFMDEFGDGGPNQGVWILIVDNDDNRLQYRGSTSGSDHIVAGETHEVVVSWHGGDSIDIYVDGVNVTSETYLEQGDSPPQVISDANEQEGMGAQVSSSGGQSDFMDGKVSELELYSVDKDAAWVQADYDASPKGGQVFFSQQAAQTTTIEIPTTTATATGNGETINLSGITTAATITANATGTGSTLFISPDFGTLPAQAAGTGGTISVSGASTLNTVTANATGTGGANLNMQLILRPTTATATATGATLELDRMHGTVDVEGQPTEGVDVNVVDKTNTVLYTTTTNSDGEWAVDTGSGALYQVAYLFDDGTTYYGDAEQSDTT